MPNQHNSSNVSKPIKEYLAEKGLSPDLPNRHLSDTYVAQPQNTSPEDQTYISYMNSVPASYSVMSQQSQEVSRQIGRLKPYLTCFESEDEESIAMRENINSAIGILHNFASIPFPVPMLSLGHENSTLFIKTDNVYGDIEIKNGNVEYLVEENSGGQKSSYYGEEKLEAGRLPSKLLVLLYKAFARTK